MLIEEDDNMI